MSGELLAILKILTPSSQLVATVLLLLQLYCRPLPADRTELLELPFGWTKVLPRFCPLLPVEPHRRSASFAFFAVAGKYSALSAGHKTRIGYGS